MDNQLLLNDRTKTEIEQYIKHPPQALMIVGLAGSGKTALAHRLASKILDSEDVANHPYFLTLTRPKDKRDIPIEDVRQVLHKLRLKTPGKSGVRRIVFIEDAHNLSGEAQNALLKALEEPAADTAYILSVPSVRSVLPTIASRVQSIAVAPVTLAQAQDHFTGKYPPIDIEGAWQLSQGRAGLLSALLENTTEHPLKQSVDSAKQFLRHDKYQRLLELDKISKDKDQLNLFLDALGKVLAALQNATVGKGGRQAGLLRSRRLVSELQSALAANTSPRLVVLELALKLEI